MRVEAGAVVDEFDLAGIGHVVARYTRAKHPDGAGWACMFTVVASTVNDLAVVHRLSAPTLAEARRSVRLAVEFLSGRADRPGVSASNQAPAPIMGGAPRTDVGPTRSPTFRLPPDHVPV